MDTSTLIPDKLENLINSYNAGDKETEAAIYELAYLQFKEIARNLKRKSPPDIEHNDAILKIAENTTSVVHDAFIKLKQTKHFSIQNAQGFFNYFSQCIYSVLIDQARKQLAKKRDFEAVHSVDTAQDDIIILEQLIDVHGQLIKLKKEYRRQVHVFIQKYVCSYALEQIADLQSISVSTVEKDIQFIRKILFANLK